MTMVTISAENPRTIRAIEIAAGAAQWLKCRTHDGRKLYAVPSQSQSGVYHLVDCEACDCQDFKRSGLRPGRIGETGPHGPCKHVLAVRLHCELVKAQQHQPRRRQLAIASSTAALAQRYDDIFKNFEGA